MTVSTSERLSVLLGQWCSEIEAGSIAFHTSSGLILHECKVSSTSIKIVMLDMSSELSHKLVKP